MLLPRRDIIRVDHDRHCGIAEVDLRQAQGNLFKCLSRDFANMEAPSFQFLVFSVQVVFSTVGIEYEEFLSVSVPWQCEFPEIDGFARTVDCRIMPTGGIQHIPQPDFAPEEFRRGRIRRVQEFHTTVP